MWTFLFCMCSVCGHMSSWRYSVCTCTSYGPTLQDHGHQYVQDCTVLGQATQGCRVGALYGLDHMASNRSQASVCVCVSLCVECIVGVCVCVGVCV